MGSGIRRVDGWYSRRGPLTAGGRGVRCAEVRRGAPRCVGVCLGVCLGVRRGAPRAWRCVCARVCARACLRVCARVCARARASRARRTLNRFGHVREVPDERLVVVARRADVARRVRRPRQRVDALRVALQLRRRQRGHADVQDNDTIRVHSDHRQIVGVLLIPLQPNQRHWRAALAVCALVDDRRVLEAPQVEHAHLQGREGRLQNAGAGAPRAPQPPGCWLRQAALHAAAGWRAAGGGRRWARRQAHAPSRRHRRKRTRSRPTRRPGRRPPCRGR